MGGSHDDILPLIRKGDAKGVDKAQEYIEKVMETIPFETLGRELTPSPAGYRPIVPAFLAGRPDAMLGLEEGDTPEGTIRIFSDPLGVCTTTADQLRKRGTAMAALVEAVQLIRPVELYAYFAGGSWNTPYHSYIQISLGTTPLDLSAVSAAFMCPVLFRGMILEVARELIGSTNESFPRSNIPEHELCEATLEDVVVPSIWDPHKCKVLKDPAKWVKERLEEAIAGKGEGVAFEGVT
jgi:hypothetical protein